MDAIGVIPARYGSTRFEGKVLADLLGKPVIQHVWENAMRASTLDDLIVATDDVRILEAVQAFGGKR
jgi:3-deoxy-manno-octulosonate cytidylyltransferase (CMP-KDO synthetase)